MNWVGPKSNDWHPYKKRRGPREPHRGEEVHVKTEAETGVADTAKGIWGLQKLERAGKDSPLEVSREVSLPPP